MSLAPRIVKIVVAGPQLETKVERDENTTWATPLIWKNSIRTEIVTSGKNRIRSYDLDGNLLWLMDSGMTDQLAISPFANNDLVYIASPTTNCAISCLPRIAYSDVTTGKIPLFSGAESS